ncbi:uncharacterized protein DNG_01600 [Cephalotrichum gorgonifer]|uniref:Rpr2 domain-containing protein n=1 Tax=Cephalotrichum gorgonifer TaxID=2041049 RepID=A0AAE8SRT1_9PEZI|nr:uncharacterized protein DNG_01600 [Cephalotrichum gorgonifer]
MTAPVLQARLNYLTDSAHLLARTVPDASAYLMTRRHALTSQHDISISDVEKQHVCIACGSILIPGCNSLLKIESDKALRRQRQRRRALGSRPKQQQDGKGKPKADEKVGRTGITKTMSCNRCARTTTVQLPPPPVIGRSKRRKTAEAAKPAAMEAATDSRKPSANAVSKKRAKNRKAGLQALLAESKASASKSSSGLTLANFMKR